MSSISSNTSARFCYVCLLARLVTLEPQSRIVLEAAKTGQGAAARLGAIPAGAFPREMAPTAARCS
jgi:hypothetical protein